MYKLADKTNSEVSRMSAEDVVQDMGIANRQSALAKRASKGEASRRMVTIGDRQYTPIKFWHKLWEDSHPAWDGFVWRDAYTEAVEKASVENRVFANDIDLSRYLILFCKRIARDKDYAHVGKAYGRRNSSALHTMRGIYQLGCVEALTPDSVAIFYSESDFDKAIARMPLKKSRWKRCRDSSVRFESEAYGVYYQAELNQGKLHLRLCYPTNRRYQYPKGSIEILLEMAGSATDFMEWIYDFNQHYVQEKIERYKTEIALLSQNRKRADANKSSE